MINNLMSFQKKFCQNYYICTYTRYFIIIYNKNQTEYEEN